MSARAGWALWRPTVPGRTVTLDELDPRAVERFRARLVPVAPRGCLELFGARNSRGYAVVRMGPSLLMTAHRRLAYVLAHGVVPSDREVHHRCGVRTCANADHLELVTGSENMAAIADDDALEVGEQFAHSDEDRARYARVDEIPF